MGNMETVWCDYCDLNITEEWYGMATGEKLCESCFNGDTNIPGLLAPLVQNAGCENCHLGWPESVLIEGVCPDCLEFTI